VEVLAECANGAAAVKAIEQHRPDVVFLDVQMPRLNGFEVLQALQTGPLPIIVFVTAHDEHAIQAFEVNAVDYLLKPYSQDRFKKALRRAREQLQSRMRQPGPDPRLEGLLSQVRGAAAANPRILVRSADRILFLKPQEIDHVEAAGNYLLLHVGKERHMIRETMGAMETRLAGAGFRRVSRSAIVNLSRIRELQPIAAGEYCVVLHNGVRLEMTCPLHELRHRMDEV
jgi:two-component system, LytTR family, response regulator